MITFFKLITNLGDTTFIIILLLILGTFFLIHQHYRSLFFIFFVTAGTQLSVFVLKTTLALPRPPEELHLISVSGFGFPSGHSASALALYGALLWLLLQKKYSLSTKIICSILCATLIFLIVASRLVLHVHSIEDVSTGLAVGGIWLVIGTVLFSKNLIKNYS
jgi:undecaprenyl-diphosphatase